MNILTLMGSPRPNGNTAKVLLWTEQALREMGHTCERIELRTLDIADCSECYQCRSKSGELCVHTDDGATVLNKMIEADRILMATPLFCWGFPARMKALVDRMYCLVDDYRNNPDYRTRIQRKPMGLIVTSGGTAQDNADLLFKAFDNMVGFLKAEHAGIMHVPFCTEPGAISEQDHRRTTVFATDFGRPDL